MSFKTENKEYKDELTGAAFIKIKNPAARVMSWQA